QAIDVNLLDLGAGIERVAGGDHQVGALAHGEGAEVVVEAEDLGGGKGNCPQGGVGGEAVGLGQSGVIGQVAAVGGGAGDQREGNAGLGQLAGGAVDGVVGVVLAAGHCGHRAIKDRYAGGLDFGDGLPGVARAGEDEFQVLLASPAERGADVGGGGNGDD